MRGVVGALLLLVACSSSPTAPTPLAPGVAAVSGKAPAIRGEPIVAGTAIGPRTLRGKVIVVNFWNPFCPPCRDEAGALERAARRFGHAGVVVVGVHYTGGQWPPSMSAARTFIDRFGVSYPVIEDPGSKLATGFAIQGIPSTVVVDRSGRMRYRILGRARSPVLDDVLARLTGTS